MLTELYTDLVHYFRVGGFVMPPLAVMTIVLWYALGYRASALKRGSKRSVRVLILRARKGKLTEPQGIIDDAVLVGLQLKDQNKPHLRRFLDDAFSAYETGRFFILITTIVGVAPLLGLLGTVVGMIETFDSLGDMSLFSQSGGIAGGISQALFTTQLGLGVAIPGLIIKGFLDRRQQRIEMELAQIKDILCADEPSVLAAEAATA